MAKVSAVLRSVEVGANKRRGFAHWCPACKQMHAIPTEGGSPVWQFDGNVDVPTFAPSIHIFTPAMPADGDYPAEPQRTICHYFIRAGRIEFCSDSAHALAGRTVELPPLPE